MASIRRTLSPVPRAGIALNGEACNVSSPLSRSSLSALNYPSSGALPSSPFAPPDKRLKQKSQYSWRRAVFHFSVCFMFGMFIGCTPFASLNLSTNIASSKNQAFMSDANTTSLSLESEARNDHVILGPQSKEQEGAKDVTGTDVDSNADDTRLVMENIFVEVKSTLIVVTPTQTGPFQAYYLNRLAGTLRLVPPPLLWVVVEMNAQSPETADVLRKTGVMYRHVVCDKNLTDVKDRRIHRRNAALSHIAAHRLDGIVYFADAENIYSVDLFEDMRKIRRFGAWVVGKVSERRNRAMLEGPVCNGTQIVGWHIDRSKRWARARRFHVGMSGFAFNSTILWDPKRWHRPTLEPIRQLDNLKEGFQVTAFVEQIVEDESQMEGLPPGCSRVMVWEIRQGNSHSSLYPKSWLMKNNLDNIGRLS
ncbi:probable beta-1,4-xylosyltransferase IRX9H isoform X1 [Punica granatum]|uniref:Glycosyltransferases n=2 Tax=Punica granatum TaxID=22663 RepID=A0A6P8EHM1_PUNGR|nr:probable beta-1,4-xylosyltransferase IRX9H isoform X1 [Punica granatum]XP_031404989.1 probable beta-1,4-xylosyltransferase IRX9H isoform X1 [Punica granatum]XP_031404998.1 probable beta-1,4-xylosyltransferase IRX9H isoform X1 [Punica granatum]